jgi:hypothetical protein
VEASAVPEVPKERQVADEPLLVSSKDEVDEGPAKSYRTGRIFQVYSTFITTVTSTATSFTFTSTVTTKTVTLGTNLLCLPPNFVVCA